MIIPNFNTDYNGDIVFDFTNSSESIKESTKKVYDRKKYLSQVKVDPLTNKVVTYRCECPSFIFRGECKHIDQNIKLVKELICPKIIEN